jgi:hypothetical protein
LPVDFCSAYVVGRIGPKHAIGWSTVFYCIFLFFLLTFTLFSWPLWLLAVLFSLSNGLFFIALYTDFSKIKNTDHGGKELSYLLIFERIGAATGPLIGGLIATFISPEVTIVSAIVVLIGSQIPLLLSGEPVRTKQHITFKGFPWKAFTRDYVALGAHGMDRIAHLIAWPLLLSVTVFATEPYAKLGALVAFTTLVSLLVARAFGRLIDARRGRELLHFGTYCNAFLHCARSFSITPVSAVTVSAVSEPVTLAYSMSIVKAFYDRSDTIEGYRIVYLATAEMVAATAKLLYFTVLFVASFYFDPIAVLTWSFVVVGVMSSGVLFQRFPALKRV